MNDASGIQPIVGPRGPQRGRATAKDFAVAAAIAAGTCLLALPGVLASWQLTPDAVDHVGIANSWVNGGGFRVPVVYSYYLPGLQPPAPALAVRAPMMPVLFALPMYFGVGLTGLAVMHVLWSGLVGAGLVLLARRWMSLAAAAAFGIVVAWSFAWILFAEQLLTEVTSVAAAVVVLACARWGLGTPARALTLIGLTFLAWLTRPSLGVLLPSIAMACWFDWGFKRAITSRPLWTYLLGFAVLQQAFSFVVRSATGFAPYVHYGLKPYIFRDTEATLFQREYHGASAFVLSHLGEVWDQVLANAQLFYDVTFAGPWYHHGGLLVLPALAYGLFRGGPLGFELRSFSVATAAFGAISVLGYGGYDPLRYPLPVIVGVWLLASIGASEVCERLAGRVATGAGARAVRAVPLVIAVLLFVESSPPTLDWATRSWSSFSEHGTIQRMMPTGRARDEWSGAASELCAHIDADAIVAAHDPWTLHVFCGNAAYWLATDLDSPLWVDRYLDERTPGYVIDDGRSEFSTLRDSPRLVRVLRRGRYSLYRVEDASPHSRPWKAPPALGAIRERAKDSRSER